MSVESGYVIEFNPDQEMEYYESRSVTRALAELRGVVKRPLKPVSIGEMEQAVAEQGASAHAMTTFDSNRSDEEVSSLTFVDARQCVRQ